MRTNLSTIPISLLLVLLVFSVNVEAATCTFNGLGDGTSWTDADNWSCAAEPNLQNDDVIIPAGFNVVNDGGDNLRFENGHDLTIHGSLDMEGHDLEMKDNGCVLTVSSTGTLTDVDKLKFKNGSSGSIAFGATVSVIELLTEDDAVLTILARCIDVSEKLKNKDDATIDGTGCINYSGTGGDFQNTGTGGLFECYDDVLTDCSLDGSYVLPIELIRFQATARSSDILVEWATATETNNDHFTIERSKDASSWEQLEYLPGAGNSNVVVEYSYIDQNPYTGTSFYRLKQTDFNGEFTNSQVVSVEYSLSLTESQITLYPNPVSNVLSLVANESLSRGIVVFDLLGNDITDRLTVAIKGERELTLDVSSLIAGYYFIKLEAEVVKFLKQ